jgi:putative peptidoglycan lipid II flippase
VLTAIALSYFSFSIPLHSIYYFLTRCFYAVFDTRTPFYISLGAILFNAILSIWFTMGLHLPVWALAISFSIAMNLQVIVLFYILNKKVKGMEIGRLIGEVIKITVAAANTSVLTYFFIRLLDGLIFDTTRTLNVFLLLLAGGIFFTTIHLFLCWLFGTKELYIITKMLLKVKEYQQKIGELYKGVE